MKASVAVTLIVCGTMLIALPYLTNILGIRQVADAMIALKNPVNLNSHLPDYADKVCLFGGALMILVGAFSGRQETKPTSRQ